MSGGKKKKNKVRYIDDGRTVADMSALGGGKKRSGTSYDRPRSTRHDKWNTYKNSVKMMFVPMLVTMAAIAVIFGIIYLFLTIAEMNM